MERKAAVKGDVCEPSWYTPENDPPIRELAQNRHELRNGCSPAQRRVLLECNRELERLILGPDPSPLDRAKLESIVSNLMRGCERDEWVYGRELARLVSEHRRGSDSRTAAGSGP